MLVGDFAHVPVGQVLVEGTNLKEHAFHVGDFGHVPAAQVLVEI